MKQIRLKTTRRQRQNGVLSFTYHPQGVLEVENDSFAKKWLELDKKLAPVTNTLRSNETLTAHPVFKGGYHLNGKATFHTNEKNLLGLLVGYGLSEYDSLDASDYMRNLELARKHGQRGVVKVTRSGLETKISTVTKCVLQKSKDGLIRQGLTSKQVSIILGPLEKEYVRQLGGYGI